MAILFFILLFISCNSSTVNDDRGNNKPNPPIEVETAPAIQIQSIDCCLDSITNSLQIESKYRARAIKMAFEIENVVLNDSLTTYKLKHKETRKWLDLVDVDSSKAYSFALNNEQYFIIKSPIKDATGLAVNFIKWLILDEKGILVYEFESLSDNPQNFHVEYKMNRLNFISFKFNNRFFHEKNFDDILFDIEIYSLSGRTVKLLEVIHSPCRCK